MSIFFFLGGIIFLVIALYYLLSIKKPGFYPPQHLLKRRAFVLTVCGLILLFMGILF